MNLQDGQYFQDGRHGATYVLASQHNYYLLLLLLFFFSLATLQLARLRENYCMDFYE